LVNEIKQTSPFRADASPSTADYSSYVGKYVSIWVRQTTSGGAPISGVTVLFQRSEDGVTWCTYHTGVTGSDGYASYDHTETCPGVVYYRGADVHGQGATNTFSIEWLQTNPPATCVPFPPCTFSYSITCIENYDHICGGPGETNCSINGTISECDKFDNRLGRTPGWTRNFYNKDGDVVIQNFGTLDGYPQSLTESTFHIHSGHGIDALHLSGTMLATGIIPLKQWDYDALNPPFFYHNGINALDVRQKWGNKNKWVMIDSCHVLADKQWGNAMSTTHGILGFSGVSYVNPDFPDTFMDNAINKKYPVVKSFRKSTTKLFDNTTAVAIVKSTDILEKDQFPGIGNISPDPSPNDDPIYIEWGCNMRGD
jgi:hypothetical protein